VAKRCKVIEKKAADFKQEMEDLFLVLMMKIPKQIQNMPMAGLEDELGLGKGAKKGSADENDANMAPPPTVLRSTRNRGRTGGDAAQKKATSQAKDSAKSVAATPSRRATRQSARFGAGAGEPETPMFDPRLPETPAMGRARRGQTIIGQASDEGIAVQLEDGTLYDGKSSVSGCPRPGRPRRRPHPRALLLTDQRPLAAPLVPRTMRASAISPGRQHGRAAEGAAQGDARGNPGGGGAHACGAGQLSAACASAICRQII
jgi:hypothetical protein